MSGESLLGVTDISGVRIQGDSTRGSRALRRPCDRPRAYTTRRRPEGRHRRKMETARSVWPEPTEHRLQRMGTAGAGSPACYGKGQAKKTAVP